MALESAETQIVPGSDEALAIEEPPDEVFEKRRIGLLAWVGIGWLGFVVVVAVLAPLLPIKSPTLGDYIHPLLLTQLLLPGML